MTSGVILSMNQYHREAESFAYDWWSGGRKVRDELVAKYSWAIPNDNAISVIARMGPIIEMGAGNGYWAKLITEVGGSVEAYDRNPGHHHRGAPGHLWHPVKEGCHETITTDHKDHTLLLVWPPYSDSLALDSLQQFIRVGGKTVVFVGEGCGGCTGDDEFFLLLESDCELIGDAIIPQWRGIHDELFVYKVK